MQTERVIIIRNLVSAKEKFTIKLVTSNVHIRNLEGLAGLRDEWLYLAMQCLQSFKAITPN